MERIAQTAPKSCYGLDFDLTDSVCRECEHQRNCFESLGRRKYTVTLDKAQFDLVPKGFRMEIEKLMGDPELPQLERTYTLCYQSVFGKQPPDRIGQHKNLILERIRESDCRSEERRVGKES